MKPMKFKSKKQWTLVLLSLILALACVPQAATETPTQVPATATTPSKGRFGDGVCESPENAQNCPDDCAPSATAITPPTGDACSNPNPHHAVISQELLDWRNWLEDGGFEKGTTEVQISHHHLDDLEYATAERLQAAARDGTWGYAITAGPGEGLTFSIKAYVEKGEDILFSFWAKSPEGETTIEPLVFWVTGEGGWGEPTRHGSVTVGAEWTEVRFVADTTRGVRYVLLSFEAGPDTVLYVDDFQVALPAWRVAEYPGESRMVGGVPVLTEPVAPVHFTLLIHIEDPQQMETTRAYFEQKTAVFRELARICHEHGGFLTIQPEHTWPQAAEAGFHPGLLAEIARDYGVVYSTHTHGPRCRDDAGVLRSSGDCSTRPEWDHNLSDDDVVEYVGELRDLLQTASGTPVTDHNGNWEFGHSSRFSEIPMTTMSAYKNASDQRTYDRLIINPWRPGQVDANRDIETFLTHTPGTEVIYIPGWGQALTRHHERALDRLRPMLSQVIYHADPDRVNTYYVLTHADHFHADDYDPDYIAYDENTGQVTYSAEFLQDLQYWDDLLTELIDPLVAEGYLQWTSLPEMGKLYQEWERQCGLP
jgi:hypothetical protein